MKKGPAISDDVMSLYNVYTNYSKVSSRRIVGMVYTQVICGYDKENKRAISVPVDDAKETRIELIAQGLYKKAVKVIEPKLKPINSVINGLDRRQDKDTLTERLAIQTENADKETIDLYNKELARKGYNIHLQ